MEETNEVGDMKKLRSASGMVPERARCVRCRFLPQYCPCCGAVLPGTRIPGGEGGPRYGEGVAAGNEGKQRKAHGSFSQGAKAVGDDDCRGSEAGETATWRLSRQWLRRLPHQPVSAYEVYQHVQSSTGGSEDDVTTAGIAVSALNAQAQRTTAVSWLRMAASEKRLYEEEAQAWNAQLVRESRPETARCVPCTIVGVGNEPATIDRVQEAFSLDAASNVELSGGKRAGGKMPKKRTATGRPNGSRVGSVTSFQLFRQRMKTQRQTNIKELARAWRGMTAEEKAPYDAAAARLRTEHLLSDPR